MCCAVGSAEKLIAMPTPKEIIKQECPGTICGDGDECCPNAGWVCCNSPTGLDICLLHFVAFFHVASLLSTGVDNKKVGVDNEKALELTNSTVFHRGRQ